VKKLTQWDEQIIRNLRQEHGDKVENVSDEMLLEVFNSWNLSDKSEPFLAWLED
jgi:hypothetical protein